jgi:hypothetical protein
LVEPAQRGIADIGASRRCAMRSAGHPAAVVRPIVTLLGLCEFRTAGHAQTQIGWRGFCCGQRGAKHLWKSALLKKIWAGPKPVYRGGFLIKFI